MATGRIAAPGCRQGHRTALCRFEEAKLAGRRALALASLAFLISLAGCTETTLRGVGSVASQPAPLPLEPPQAAASQEPAPAAAVEPVALAAETAPPPPPVAASKAEAIAQMRSKAAASGANKPNIFAPVAEPPDRMSAEDKAASRAELEAAAARNRALLADDAANARAAEVKRLQTKAQSHYEEALKEIEN